MTNEENKENGKTNIQAFFIKVLAETVLFGSLWGGRKDNNSDNVDIIITDYLDEKNKQQKKEL